MSSSRDFAVPADAYDRFMGRYSRQLSPQLASLGGVTAGDRVLDVGCGPGALTAHLVELVGAQNVAAVDPSESFVAACRARNPGVDVQRASAESLPHADDTFDASLAQLVVHFMRDPVAGLAEMARVTRPGGVVAACVWDHAHGMGMLTTFWAAVAELDPGARDEADLPGAREGDLEALFIQAGLGSVEATVEEASVEYAGFDDWWEPFTYGVGPAGAYVAGLDERRRAALRERCRSLLPDGSVTMTARAWAARGLV